MNTFNPFNNRLFTLFAVLTLMVMSGLATFAQDGEEEEELPECPVFESEPTEVRVSYYMGAGLAFQQTGQLDRALFSFTCVTLVIDPDYLPAHMSRAVINTRLRNYEEAIEDYTTALDIDGDLVPAINNRGIVYAALGEYEDAAADFDSVIEIDAEFVIGYNNRAVIHILEDEFDEALAVLEQVIDLTGIDDVYAELTDEDRPEDAEDPEYERLDARAYALLGIVYSAQALENYEIYNFLSGGVTDSRITSAASALESRFTFELRLDDGTWLLTAFFSPIGEEEDE